METMLRALSAGRHEVSIGLRGYLRLLRTILLAPGDKLSLDLELTSPAG